MRSVVRKSVAEDRQTSLSTKRTLTGYIHANYLEMKLKTIVIQNHELPASGNALSRLLGIPKDVEDEQNSTMWFGIENDSGVVYRVIGVDGIADYVMTLRRLSAAGYWVESLEAKANGALHAVVKAHGACQPL